MSIIVTLAILAAAQSAAPTTVDPLAPAATGMLQCYEPDVAKRSCRSLAGYRKRPDGKYDNTATVLVSSAPLVIVDTVTAVEIDAGAVCGTIRKQDIDVAGISLEGQKLGESEAVGIRQLIAGGLATIIDHRICTTYLPAGSGYVARATIEGSSTPPVEQKMIWVAPTDGYKVAA